MSTAACSGGAPACARASVSTSSRSSSIFPTVRSRTTTLSSVSSTTVTFHWPSDASASTVSMGRMPSRGRVGTTAAVKPVGTPSSGSAS